MLHGKTMISLLAGILMTGAVMAQAPAGAPAGATGLCKDGSYWTGPTKKGACRGHKGVQDWYAATGAATAPATTAAAPAAPVPAAPATAAPKAAPAAPATAAAPGGGAGQVWVNTPTKVYHCPGDRWYGKTKSGSYMTESQAVAQGAHPDHGKACQK